VLVAVEDIPAGTVIVEPDRHFVVRPFLPESVPPGSLSDPQQVRNWIAIHPIRPGTPCTPEQFRQGWPEIPANRHAITVPVAAAGQACELMLPGSRVDILRPATGVPSASFQVVLRDILVVAVNSGTIWGEAVAPDGPRQLTLALTSEEMDRLDQARSTTPLTVVLRQP
jgi:Flp pilus assembly protein CpaB